MTDELQKKVDRAVKLIQAAGKLAKEHGQPLEICYSGGKDSDVILELAKMSGVEYRPIYKNTTIDPPGTIAHVKSKGVEVVQPKMTFREVMHRVGLPSRFRRACCDKLKEYKILDYAVIGVRRYESPKRAARYQEPELCRVYNKNEKTRQYLPILEWTDEDVAAFISERGIKCHPLYYGGVNSMYHAGLAVWDALCNQKQSALPSSNSTPIWSSSGAVAVKNFLTRTLAAKYIAISTMPTSGFACHSSAVIFRSIARRLERICSVVRPTAGNSSWTTSILTCQRFVK